MPIYEYECATCAQIHEISQKMSDAPLAACPVCAGAVKKIMSRTSFALKGTGYYTTDYKRPSAAAAATPPAATPAKPA